MKELSNLVIAYDEEGGLPLERVFMLDACRENVADVGFLPFPFPRPPRIESFLLIALKIKLSKTI